MLERRDRAARALGWVLPSVGLQAVTGGCGMRGVSIDFSEMSFWLFIIPPGHHSPAGFFIRQKLTRADTRMSRPERGAKSFRKEAWRRATTSKMLFADSAKLKGRSLPQGRKFTSALTRV